jgi:hypothetical protein
VWALIVSNRERRRHVDRAVAWGYGEDGDEHTNRRGQQMGFWRPPTWFRCLFAGLASVVLFGRIGGNGGFQKEINELETTNVWSISAAAAFIRFAVCCLFVFSYLAVVKKSISYRTRPPFFGTGQVDDHRDRNAAADHDTRWELGAACSFSRGRSSDHPRRSLRRLRVGCVAISRCTSLH